MSNEQDSNLLTDDVRELLRLVCQTDITELSLERGIAKIHIKRTTATAAPVVGTTTTMAVGGSAQLPVAMMSEEELAASQGHAVTSPMVGTFYAAPSPKDPPYVKVGDEVQPGDVIGIVEAMKMMNEIESEIHGHVAAVMVENGQPVEYGQLLMTIIPLE